MDASGHRQWLPRAILTALVYLAAGLIFAALAAAAASNQLRVTWRAAAYVTSAIAFAAHIRYEYFRLRSSLLVTAWHASASVALGALGLALAANIHARSSGSSHHRLLATALVAWPLLTAVPAFVVALAATAVLARTRRGV